MLSVKQGGIKYHFLSLWYNSTWDWTKVFRNIGEHSTHLANDAVLFYLRIFDEYKTMKFMFWRFTHEIYSALKSDIADIIHSTQ